MLWLWLVACNPIETPAACESDDAGLISLPTDDGPHDAITERWSWTGHLQDEDAGQFSFQLAFSETGQTLLVQAAVTDINGQTFHYEVEQDDPENDLERNGYAFDRSLGTIDGEEGNDTLHLETGPYTLDLGLTPYKPPAIHHGDGYADYRAGGFAYYYSRSRMETTGTLRDRSGSRTVTGRSWFDHSWGDDRSISEIGWDWFALSLDDGREYMLFNVRDGEEQGLTAGSWMDPGCGVLDIGAEFVQITALGTWKSPWSDCTYPSGWVIQILDELYTVTPTIEDQEFAPSGIAPTWEGSATVVGPMTGRASIALTGYCQ
jgi:predicted secreted hydrolase